jgi:DNA-binding NarL/FixJ family response regulator
MMHGMTIRVLVIDDHHMFADALAERLSRAHDMTVVGIATTAVKGLEAARALRPDVVTLDANLGDADGVEVARELRTMAAPPKVVMITCVDDIDRVLRAIWAGALAWVPKETGASALIEVIRGAARGDAWIPPSVLGVVLNAIVASSDGQPPDRTPLAALTPRERQVLRCMLAGLDRSATAELLGLSLNTVRTHAQSVLTKLHVHSALEAVSVALNAGMRPDRVPSPFRRLGVVQTTRAPAAALRRTYPRPTPALPAQRAQAQHEPQHSRPARRPNTDAGSGAIGVGVLVRWPDPGRRVTP